MKGLAELQAVLGSGNDAAPPIAVKDKESKKKDEPVKALTKEDKFKELANLNKALNKQFDSTQSLVRLGDRVGIPIPSISTGLPSIDEDVLGCGGIPRGRVVEIYGPASSGKTTLCLHIIAREQQNTENLCAIVDAEHALDPSYAASLGVNVDELLVSQPSSGEDALETVEALVDSKLVSIVIVDSVSALVPRAELAGEMGDAQMGLQARLMSQACRKLIGKAALNNVTIIFINQLREAIGVMFGNPERTSGGKALQFYASVRLDVRRKESIGPKDNPTGHVLKVKAAKNKCGVPFRETLVNLVYGEGLDTFADTVSYCVKTGIIQQAGASYSYEGQKIGYGLENTINGLRENKELFDKIALTLKSKPVTLEQ
jgi:recombination protein RecA